MCLRGRRTWETRHPQEECEREALTTEERNRRQGPDTDVYCLTRIKSKGWVCTREPGHSGDHIAAGNNAVYYRWAQRRAHR